MVVNDSFKYNHLIYLFTYSKLMFCYIKCIIDSLKIVLQNLLQILFNYAAKRTTWYASHIELY